MLVLTGEPVRRTVSTERTIWCGTSKGQYVPRIEGDEQFCGGCGHVLKYMAEKPLEPATA